MPTECTPGALERKSILEWFEKGARSMFSPVLTAYLELIRFGFHIRRRNFAALHSVVRKRGVDQHTSGSTCLADLCRAVDLACIWYGKRVLCLQRSAATTCLLRRHGIPAQLVIGIQQIPFNAHAWVEVEGRIVSDRPYMREMYAVLERI